MPGAVLTRRYGRRPAGSIAVFPQLTDREHEILDLVSLRHIDDGRSG